MTVEDLIAYAKPYLKQRGFKKVRKRWTKDTGEFTLVFFIQGSWLKKDDFYVRPGIFINEVSRSTAYYGHFWNEIRAQKPEEVMLEFEKFCMDWTNKERVKRIISEFAEWDKRNPIEKRRDDLVDYDADPVPDHMCFSVPKIAIEYILKHF